MTAAKKTMTAANKTKTAAKKTDDSSNYQTNGQTEVREHRFLRMPSMGVRELGRQPQFVLIKCFQSNDTYLYQLTAPFGPLKTAALTFGPACVFFLRQPRASRHKGVNCG